MDCSIKSKHNCAKGMLNLLEFSHIIYLCPRLGGYSGQVDC